MELEREYRLFAEAFGRALVARDFAQAHEMFAPWLAARISEDDLCALVTEEVTEVVQQTDLDEAAWPTGVDVTPGNSAFDVLAAAKAREAASGYGEAFPDEVTAETFRRWVQVRLVGDAATSEHVGAPGLDNTAVLDNWVRLWVAIAQGDSGLCVGHLEIET